ncbi:MAG: PilZ domain-containing protein [Gemmataceae bacterium]|nr:PilZ domain-containing protein [Gemmataceae bacterium]MDW8265609.1 PilZ domain-containing protein [Gemmataceae bacterium]
MFRWLARLGRGLVEWFRRPARDVQPAPKVPVEEPRPRQNHFSQLEASCHPIATTRDDPWPAQVRDLSPRGIGLLLKRRFEPGTLLAVELQSLSQSYSRTLVARVVHAKAQSSGDWMIGCMLASRLDEDELEALCL